MNHTTYIICIYVESSLHAIYIYKLENMHSLVTSRTICARLQHQQKKKQKFQQTNEWNEMNETKSNNNNENKKIAQWMMTMSRLKNQYT